MRDIFEFIVPATFGLLFFAVFFGFLGWLRWMRFREMIALAERGYTPAVAPNGTDRMLRWALVLVALGLALSCGVAPIALDDLGSFPAMIPGFALLFLGLAFLLYWLITGGREHLAKRMGHLAAATVPAAPPVPPPPAAWSPDAPGDDQAAFDAVDAASPDGAD